MCVRYHLTLDLYEMGILPVFCRISNLREDERKVKIQWQEALLQKHPQDIIFKQLDEVPRSLGGRSRKAKKVARSGTTTSWENRVGRNQFGHKSSRSLETKPERVRR